jgi:CYTH domain-containing protein
VRLVERLRRVRTRERERYYRTVKSGTGLARLELEEETTRDVFEAMWPLTAGRRVSKRRYRIPDGGVVWEVDEFTDRGLVLAEVELSRVDQPVVLPDWLAPTVARDVTGEPEYVNANLAR